MDLTSAGYLARHCVIISLFKITEIIRISKRANYEEAISEAQAEREPEKAGDADLSSAQEVLMCSGYGKFLGV